MIKTLLLSLLLLTGCASVVPVTQTWPEAPGLQSMQTCGTLKTLESDTTLSQVAEVINHNYSEYWQCVVKLEAWQEWYRKQEIIHKNIK
jgi:uncharacterized protein YceK